MGGKKSWYIVDRLSCSKSLESIKYVGHECIMILNTNEQEAHIRITVYFSDRDPVEGITLTVPPKRIMAINSSDKEMFGGVDIGIHVQYSLEIHSDIDVIVQYGRMDVQQPNLAYMALLGYGE